MAVYPILTVPDPRLKQISQPVKEVTDDIRQLMDDMLESMYAADGIGLAAIQIGIPKRIIVMDLTAGDEEQDPQPRYFVNPEIIQPAEQLVPYLEGCLSVPEVYEEIDRPERCRLRYLDYEGNEREEEATGLFAVCIQHEMDHLEGILFIDHLSRLKREKAVKAVKKRQKQRL